jgi:predicted RNA-binding protein with PUA-like domain
MAKTKRYWLLKSEPDAYSIHDLKKDGKTCWDGVRNYQARNYMRDDMQLGDGVLFYHSNADPPGVAGIAEVCRRGYPDHSAFDKKDKHHDPKSDPDNPTWIMVDIKFVEAFEQVVSLDALKAAKRLEGMLVIQRGQRLSVQPVEPEHFKIVRDMGNKKT